MDTPMSESAPRTSWMLGLRRPAWTVYFEVRLVRSVRYRPRRSVNTRVACVELREKECAWSVRRVLDSSIF